MSSVTKEIFDRTIEAMDNEELLDFYSEVIIVHHYSPFNENMSKYIEHLDSLKEAVLARMN